jgi:hypothetical protein
MREEKFCLGMIRISNIMRDCLPLKVQKTTVYAKWFLTSVIAFNLKCQQRYKANKLLHICMRMPKIGFKWLF